MDFEKVLIDGSRHIIELCTDSIGNSPERFSHILDLAFTEKHQISGRAARVVALSCEYHPDLITPHIDDIIIKIISSDSDPLVRCLIKILCDVPKIENEELLGRLVNNCFDRLLSSEESIAVKVYSIHLLYQISNNEPGLKYELIAAIEDQIPKGSSGTKSVGRKYLKKLYKETNS